MGAMAARKPCPIDAATHPVHQTSVNWTNNPLCLEPYVFLVDQGYHEGLRPFRTADCKFADQLLTQV